MSTTTRERLMFIAAVNQPVSKNKPLEQFRNQMEKENKAIVEKVRLAIAADDVLKAGQVTLQAMDSYLNIFVGIVEVDSTFITSAPGQVPNWQIADSQVQALLKAIFSWRDAQGATLQSVWPPTMSYVARPESATADESAALTWSLVRLQEVCAEGNTVVSLLGKKGIGLQ